MIRGGIVTFVVQDVAASIRFYVETLGLKLVAERGADWAVVDAGEGFRIGLRRATQASRGDGQGPGVGLVPKVPLEEALAVFRNRGVSFEMQEDDLATQARFCDLDGNLLYLRQEK
jgi:catechol 2,3-dioxygenase-like lactoylglutathione lyase family enzyme